MSLLQDIAVHTGISVFDAQRIIATAPKRYKQYTIPKRSGGVRLIAQPSKELKVLQRFVMQHILIHLPVHRTATAYVRRKNIIDNAQAHVQNAAIMKLDFNNFFPSITVADWTRYCQKKRLQDVQPDDQTLLINILFWGRGTALPECLSIGAPTSPLISNLIMHDLDTKIFGEASRRGITYTRYADDITISSQSVDNLINLEKYIRNLLEVTKSPRLTLNEKKRGLFTKGNRRLVTGLVITPTSQISIGRERKRMISSMIHKFTLGSLSVDDVDKLRGLLGFAIANEPDFLSRMRRKYGDEAINAALRSETKDVRRRVRSSDIPDF